MDDREKIKRLEEAIKKNKESLSEEGLHESHRKTEEEEQMTSRNKHMKRSHRSYKDIGWQNRFRRLVWAREYDNNIKAGAVERVKNFIKAAVRKHKGTIDDKNENE